ncbi:unnamed protein product [marine sediment metagenome]|uniref:Uncharacterized protein n=1 Tax=marine sediment metagenome TaxID=412755 RepID=X1N1T6_9ZZZZ
MANKMKWFSPKMYTVLTTLFAVAVLNIFFSIGVSVGQATIKPQTTAVIEPSLKCRLVERHTVQYVDTPVTVVEYIERTQKIPAELRNFGDIGELKQWLVEVDMNTSTTYFQSPGVTIDCDDYALALQSKALTNGYILSFEIISRSEYEAVFKSQLPSGQSLHAINLAIIGNSAYYIEPQTSEIGFAAHLD